MRVRCTHDHAGASSPPPRGTGECVCPHTRLPRLPLHWLFNSIQFNSIPFAQASRDARSSEESLRLKRVAASEARIRRAKRDDAFLERTHLDCFGQVGVCPYATWLYLPLHLRIHSCQLRRRNAAGALNAARKCATRCALHIRTLARHVFTVTIA
jgi:hypothetical protein